MYRLSLLVQPLEDDQHQAVLEHIQVTVCGETRRYDLGTITYDDSGPAWAFPVDMDHGLDPRDNYGIFGQYVPVTQDGSSSMQNITYHAQKDVTITGIRFLNGEDVTIQRVSMIQTAPDGATVDTVWDQKQPISLTAGESIALNISISDPFFAVPETGCVTRYLMLAYEVDSVPYEVGITIYFVQFYTDPFAYVAAKDGLDARSLLN